MAESPPGKRLLDDDVRKALLHAVRETIERHGGRLTLPIVTYAAIPRAH